MGIFDSQNYAGGGMIDRLLASLAPSQAPSFSGLPSDTADYGPAPALPPLSTMTAPIPMAAPALAPVRPAPAAPAPAAPQSPLATPVVQQAAGDVAGHIMTGYQNLRKGGGLLGSVVAAITGQRNDPYGVAQQQQTQLVQQRYAALKAAGIPDAQARLAAIDPEYGKKIADQAFGQDDLSVVQTGETPMGGKQFQIFNKHTGDLKPIGGTGASSDNGLGNMNLSGDAYLASLPKAQQQTVLAMTQGRQAPPSSFALAKPYWQNMIAAARNYDPSFDESTWKSRSQMATDLGKSSNSSMGGILSNGKSAFEHLATLSDSASDMGNYNGPNIPGGSYIGAIENAVGNSRPSNATKVSGLDDASLKYGQESTKFYAGTGGGEAERMEARKVVNSNASPATMAGFLQSERDLMLGRLKQKEDQIRDVMGPAYLAAHPVVTPDLQATVARIDKNIAGLRGASTASPAASGTTSSGLKWSVR
jgi:hypothetical protein